MFSEDHRHQGKKIQIRCFIAESRLVRGMVWAAVTLLAAEVKNTSEKMHSQYDP